MICIYHERYAGALQTAEGRRLSCKASWIETSAQNLRSAVGAFAHAPWIWGAGGEIQVEIDGVLFAADQLPRYGPHLLKRCTHWLDNHRRWESRSIRPMFGL